MWRVNCSLAISLSGAGAHSFISLDCKSIQAELLGLAITVLLAPRMSCGLSSLSASTRRRFSFFSWQLIRLDECWVWILIEGGIFIAFKTNVIRSNLFTEQAREICLVTLAVTIKSLPAHIIKVLVLGFYDGGEDHELDAEVRKILETPHSKTDSVLYWLSFIFVPQLKQILILVEESFEFRYMAFSFLLQILVGPHFVIYYYNS